MTSDAHKEAIEERAKHTSGVLDSTSTRIVVVAGPGTGKTHLFKQLLEKRGGENALTLSFINALVDELSLDLCGLSSVKTLHGFSLATLNGATKAEFRIYPKLCDVIRRDAELLHGERPPFEDMFQTGEVDEAWLDFYRERKKLYGSYYGFSDAMFAVVKYLEAHPEKTPSFSQLIVDEYQDFNRTEVRLIELLAERSPIAIAGDDDQSLYMDLKKASPEFIRELHGPSRPEYEAHSLPFCSRSTRVIVDAVNDITGNASAQGLLAGRVAKPYEYFTSDEKDRECAENPKVVHASVYEKQIPDLIQKEMRKIARETRRKASILVIVPPQRKSHIPYLSDKLREKGFAKIGDVGVRSKNLVPLIDGLLLLVEDSHSELGWRIAAEGMLPEAELSTLLKSLPAEGSISAAIPKAVKKQIGQYVKALKRIRKNEEVDPEELAKLLAAIDVNPIEVAREQIREEILSRAWSEAAPRELRNMDIVVTTIPSSKGLAADYVFVTHFDQRYYSTNGEVLDKDVYNFLVALTRARRRAYLISTGGARQRPTLLDWIASERIGGV